MLQTFLLLQSSYLVGGGVGGVDCDVGCGCVGGGGGRYYN